MQVMAAGQRDDPVPLNVFQQLLEGRNLGRFLRSPGSGYKGQHRQPVRITDSPESGGIVPDPGGLVGDGLVAEVPAGHQAHAFPLVGGERVPVGLHEPRGHGHHRAGHPGDRERPQPVGSLQGQFHRAFRRLRHGRVDPDHGRHLRGVAVGIVQQVETGDRVPAQDIGPRDVELGQDLVQFGADVLVGPLAGVEVAVTVAEALDDDHVEVIQFPDQRRKVQGGCRCSQTAKEHQRRPGGSAAKHIDGAAGDVHPFAVRDDGGPLVPLEQQIDRR